MIEDQQPVELIHESDLDKKISDYDTPYDPLSLNSESIRDYLSRIPKPEFEKPNILFDWDDTIQYTSIGLLQLLAQSNIKILEKYHREFNFESFINRKEMNGIDYVVTFVKDFYDEDEILEFMKQSYKALLVLSPRSTHFRNIFKWGSIMNTCAFVFKFPFNCEELTKSLHKSLAIPYQPLMFFSDSIDVSEVVDIYHPNIIVSNRMGYWAKLLIDEKQREGVSFIGTPFHNGLDPMFISAYIRQREASDIPDEFGPLFSKYEFYEEKLDGD